MIRDLSDPLAFLMIACDKCGGWKELKMHKLDEPPEVTEEECKECKKYKYKVGYLKQNIEILVKQNEDLKEKLGINKE